jgi:hypothetical protein
VQSNADLATFVGNYTKSKHEKNQTLEKNLQQIVSKSEKLQQSTENAINKYQKVLSYDVSLDLRGVSQEIVAVRAKAASDGLTGFITSLKNTGSVDSLQVKSVNTNGSSLDVDFIETIVAAANCFRSLGNDAAAKASTAVVDRKINECEKKYNQTKQKTMAVFIKVFNDDNASGLKDLYAQTVAMLGSISK